MLLSRSYLIMALALDMHISIVTSTLKRDAIWGRSQCLRLEKTYCFHKLPLV